jgi:hypothetical protein
MFETKVVEKIKTHFMLLFFPKIVSFEILWENMVEPGWPHGSMADAG